MDWSMIAISKSQNTSMEINSAEVMERRILFQGFCELAKSDVEIRCTFKTSLNEPNSEEFVFERLMGLTGPIPVATVNEKRDREKTLITQPEPTTIRIEKLCFPNMVRDFIMESYRELFNFRPIHCDDEFNFPLDFITDCIQDVYSISLISSIPLRVELILNRSTQIIVSMGFYDEKNPLDKEDGYYKFNRVCTFSPHEPNGGKEIVFEKEKINNNID